VLVSKPIYPNQSNHTKMSAAPPAKDPEPLHLYYSRPLAFLAAGLLLTIALWLVYIFVAGLFSPNIVLMIAGGASILFIGPVLAYHAAEPLRACTRRDPVVTLDAEGITDRRQKAGSFLSWDEVGKIWLGYTSQTRSHLIFEYRNAAAAKNRGQGHGKAFLRRAAFMSDWNVNLRLLACKPADVLRVAKRFQQAAVRREIVKKNGPSSQGWTGSL
jgi:hypothetical protein